MNRVELKELFTNTKDYIDKEITVAGWIRSNRDSKSVGFLTLSDGSCFENLQIVYSNSLGDKYGKIASLNIGAAIIAKGTIIATPNAKQAFEMQAVFVEVEGDSTPDYPLQKKRHTMEYLRTITHLRPRTNMFQAAFRVRSICAYAIHKFFNERGFVYVHTPIITGSDAEGAGEMFQVTTLNMEKVMLSDAKELDYEKDFFGKHTSLTVSGQLNGETFAQASEKSTPSAPHSERKIPILQDTPPNFG